MIIVTGGAGFIGSNFVLDWLANSGESVVNLDKLTYAGNLENLASLQGDARRHFVQGDLGDRALVDALLAQHRPRAEAGWRVQEIEPVPSSVFPSPAQPPNNSRLNTERLQSTFGITLPPWQSGVDRLLAEIL